MPERVQKDSVDLQGNALRVVYNRTSSDRNSAEYDMSATLYWWLYEEGIQMEAVFDTPKATQQVFDLLKLCRSAKFATIQSGQATVQEEGHE